MMPFDDEDDKTMHYHRDWVEARCLMEASEEKKPSKSEHPVAVSSSSENSAASVQSSDASSIVPRPMDVILGRSNLALSHVGNTRYRSMLDENYEAYEQTDKIKKTTFAAGIVKSIQASGGRFLKQGKHGWEEITFIEARNKVSNFYRDRRKTASRGRVESGPKRKSAR